MAAGMAAAEVRVLSLLTSTILLNIARWYDMLQHMEDFEDMYREKQSSRRCSRGRDG